MEYVKFDGIDKKVSKFFMGTFVKSIVMIENQMIEPLQRLG